MNTSKTAIKKINIHGRGTSIYLSKREREHIGVTKKSDIIIDTTIPFQLRIMSIDRWKEIHKGIEDVIRK